MRTLLHLLQIAVVVGLCALLGAKLVFFDPRLPGFSVTGAVAGSLIALVALAALAALRSERRVEVRGAQAQTLLLILGTLSFFVAMAAFVGLIYTHAAWLKPVLIAAISVGFFCVVAVLISIFMRWRQNGA